MMFPLLPIVSPPPSSLQILSLPYPDNPLLIALHTRAAFVFTYGVSSALRAWLLYHACRASPFVDLSYGHSGRTAKGIRACAV